jgi:hypothetical protein
MAMALSGVTSTVGGPSEGALSRELPPSRMACVGMMDSEHSISVPRIATPSCVLLHSTNSLHLTWVVGFASPAHTGLGKSASA